MNIAKISIIACDVCLFMIYSWLKITQSDMRLESLAHGHCINGWIVQGILLHIVL